jgi:hypothetical protein
MNRERLKKLLGEYGKLAIYIYIAIFVVVLVGFALVIQMGIKVDSAAGTAGVWGTAWVATKVAQPLRILATIALTPLLAQLLRRRKPTSEGPEPRS